jgi:hypothetical protein
MVGALAGVVANPFIGRFKDAYGWEPLFHLLGGLFLVAAATWLLIDSERRLVTEEEQPAP